MESEHEDNLRAQGDLHKHISTSVEIRFKILTFGIIIIGYLPQCFVE